MDGVEHHGVLSLEEVRRRGERTREGSDALEALADFDPRRSIAQGAKYGDVRAGGHLEAGHAAADNKGVVNEVAILFEFDRWLEKDGACRSSCDKQARVARSSGEKNRVITESRALGPGEYLSDERGHQLLGISNSGRERDKPNQ